MTNQSTSSEMETSLIFGASVPAVTGEENDNDTLFITDNGLETGTITEKWKFDAESQTWYQVPTGDTCPAPMSRTALRNLRNAGGLSKDCHYVITDPSVDGNLDVQEIILHAVNANTLSMQAGILTSHNANAFQGVYDIDQNDVLEVTDNLENEVLGNSAILTFPFGNTSVTQNVVDHATLTVNGGTARRNHIKNNANVTVNSGDFTENTVEGDANVTTSTTGDVDNNVFRANSNTTVSGTANLDMSEIYTDANLVITGGNVTRNEFKAASNTSIAGGSFYDNEVENNADVTILSGTNYENTFGNGTIYRQVGTGYIRFSTIEGTTAWTNGDTNLTNVQSYTSTVNTTGSVGTISNSTFNRAYAVSLQNIPSLTITDSTISNYGQIVATNATRLYMYRGSVSDGSRVILSAGASVDMSYTNLDSYSYIQNSANGGSLRVNYTDLSSLGYIRQQSTGSNFVDRCEVTSQASMRFDGDATGGRFYYCRASSGGVIYQTTGSVNCYMYYCSSDNLSQIYTTNTTDARLYYNEANSYSYIRVYGTNTGQSIIYYCNAHARGYIEHINNTARLRYYSVDASGQSIVRGTATGASNLYYSNFSAYYYLLMTRTAGTLSGAYGMGRRSFTVTNPATTAPYNVGPAWNNIQ